MKHKHNFNEKGLVSIISTVLIVLIITIVTLSLSVFSRRELRQALDEQLSSQALYAAESGINDAISLIENGLLNSNVKDCSESEQAKITSTRILNSEANVRYTCILVNQSPTEINTDVTTSKSKLYSLDPGEGKSIASLTFSWKNTNASSPIIDNCSPTLTAGCFTQSGTWGDRLGVLRVRLFPLPATDINSDTFDASNAIDIVGYPGGSTASLPFAVSAFDKTKLQYANCTNGICTTTISDLNVLASKFYVQLSSLYKDINVTLTGSNASGGGNTEFFGAQVKIDSTGAASDVFKRLEVSVPLGESSDLPFYSFGVGDKLCKRFETSNTGTVNADIDTTNRSPAF